MTFFSIASYWLVHYLSVNAANPSKRLKEHKFDPLEKKQCFLADYYVIKYK
jgi:hypothetical protein